MYRSQDGIVRSVLLKTASGNKTRPIHRIDSLELDSQSELNDNENVNNDMSTDDVNESVSVSHEDTTNENVEHKEVKTRIGRVVKPVARLDL